MLPCPSPLKIRARNAVWVPFFQEKRYNLLEYAIRSYLPPALTTPSGCQAESTDHVLVAECGWCCSASCARSVSQLFIIQAMRVVKTLCAIASLRHKIDLWLCLIWTQLTTMHFDAKSHHAASYQIAKQLVTDSSNDLGPWPAAVCQILNFGRLSLSPVSNLDLHSPQRLLRIADAIFRDSAAPLCHLFPTLGSHRIESKAEAKHGAAL